MGGRWPSPSAWLAVGAQAVLAAAVLAGPETARSQCAQPAGWLTASEGSVELRRAPPAVAEPGAWQPAARDAQLCPGDTLRTGERSRAALRLSNETTLRLDQHTTLTLAAPADGGTLLDVLGGAINVLTRTPKPFRVRTPYLNAGVEGTEFLVRAGADSAQVGVFEGKVRAENAFGVLALSSGESAIATRDSAPQRSQLVQPADAVQWALHYPSILQRGIDEAPPLREADALLRAGRIGEAFARLDAVPASERGPRLLAYRAELLLRVGRVDEASSELERALALDAKASDAHAVQAIVAVVRNERERALELAQRAIELDANATSGRIALSYAQQAYFRIEAALASAEKAAELAPRGGLVWARVAELRMSVGDLDAALLAAQHAAQIEPTLARTQSVLGFAYLTRIETGAAKQAFEKAIEYDQGDPLPRLGLGIARIRDGELGAGRGEIEVAASLDPLNSLVRSYLGKAYYEEKRDPLAASQFGLAKTLDPRDPTPYFYDAIRKQTENLPVEALQDLDKSIELNDNRAVYRSRLLLDEDLAARSAALARIYDDLGFAQLAVVAGSRAIAYDPTSYSAHRFLADAYRTEPRHEIARVSEVLQSQLLQPLSAAPIEPQFAEDKSFFVRDAGPARAGFGDLNSLFIRNGVRGTADGLVGSRSTLGDQLVVSILESRTSFSLGQYRFLSDGLGAQGHLERNIYNAFGQALISGTFSAQIEARRSYLVRSGLLDFDPQFLSREAERITNDSLRVGARYSLSPGFQIIFSGIHQHQNSSEITGFLNRDPAANIFTTDTDRLTNASTAEVQALWRGEVITLITGGGYFSSRSRVATVDSSDFFEIPDPAPPERLSRSVRNLYSYMYIRSKHYLAQLGLSAEYMQEPDVTRQRLNPKVGLVLNPTADLTLRIAYLQTLKRPLIANQTIEPTQVVGFNQFFDDPNLTIARRAGLAIDYHASDRLAWGAEFASSRLRIPVPDDMPTREKAHRIYVSSRPNKALAINATYSQENLERQPDDPSAQGFLDIATRRISLGAVWLIESGLAFQVTGNIVRQRADLRIAQMADLIQQRNRFALFDISLTYRLPSRLGIVAIGVKNVSDRRFRFQEIDPTNPRFAPARFGFVRLSLTF
jgi:tetratricopeptide (TPR) repeat protein